MHSVFLSSGHVSLLRADPMERRSCSVPAKEPVPKTIGLLLQKKLSASSSPDGYMFVMKVKDPSGEKFSITLILTASLYDVHPSLPIPLMSRESFDWRNMVQPSVQDH